MKTALRDFLLLAAAALFPAVHAAAADVSAPVAKMQSAYARMDGFRADFTQKLLQKDSGVTETRTGFIIFKKPMLVRWETKAPHAELLLSTGKEVWNYLPDEELAYRYPKEIAEDSRSLIQVVTGQSPLGKDFDVEPAQSPEDGGLIHLLLHPKEPTTELTEAQVWLEPGSFLMRRASIMDFYGNTNTVELSNMQPGAAGRPADFTFTPPAGTEVEDHVEKPHPAKTTLRD